MFRLCFSKIRSISIVIFVWGCVHSLPIFSGSSLTEMDKIEKLLAQVKTSQVIFIRNGREHSALEAFDHLKMKWQRAQNSWFSPPLEKWTAHLFIKEIASRSSFSGKAYMIRLSSGKLVEAELWLMEKMKEIELQGTSTVQDNVKKSLK